MIGRVIAGALGVLVVSGAALVFGYRGYQRFLEWLVAGQGPGLEPTGRTGSTS